ncbi:MAG: hypothetical protein RLZZ360_852 [Candidatus Parcubacteria bacterium]|jgi:type II secretory pathway component PulF
MSNIVIQFDRIITIVTDIIRQVIGQFIRIGVLLEVTKQQKMSERDFLHLLQRLSVLLSAGVQLSVAIKILSEQISAQKQKQYLNDMYHKVLQGWSLTKIFETEMSMPMSVKNLITLGEKTGTLPEQLRVAVTELMAARQARQRVVAALVYPTLLFGVTLTVTIFLLVVIFPKITPVFAGLSSQLPWSTRVLMATSAFLSTYGLWLLVAMVTVTLLLILAARKFLVVNQLIVRIICMIRPVHYFIQTFNQIHICRMLAVLLKSGVRSSEAVALVALHTKNPLFKEALEMTAGDMQVGKKLSTALARYGSLFRSDMVGLIGVAEQSGSLPQTLQMLATIYDEDLDIYQKKLTTLIEPLLMIVMGLTIGFIAVSIISPLYELSHVLSS